MHRRADDSLRRTLLVLPAVIIGVLMCAAALFLLANRSSDTSSSDRPIASATADGADEVAPVSDFYPEQNNLSDCLGLVERPGCGSEARGGWGQNVVFVLLAAGVGTVITRVVIGVRRNREQVSA